MDISQTHLSRLGVLSSLALLATGCDNLSSVGDQDFVPPQAVATIVNYASGSLANGDVQTSVRSQAEILLTGSNSEAGDSPILDHNWQIVNESACPAVLTVRDTRTVNATLPRAAAPATCEFQLTVTDANGLTATAMARVQLIPALDSDRFLTQSRTSPRMRVVVATRSEVFPTADTYTLTSQYCVTYQARSGARQTLGNCQDSALSPDDRYAFTLSPPVQIGFAQGSGGDSLTDYRNPVIDLPIPSIDQDAILREFQEQLPGSASSLPDPAFIDSARLDILLTLSSTSGALQNQGKLYVLNLAGEEFESAESAGGNATVLLIPGDPDGDQANGKDRVEELRIASGALENRLTAEAYYAAIDPGSLKLTFRDWLIENCFDPDAEETEAQKKYGADAHAVYVNNYDLGFGRDMYFRTTKPPGCSSATFGQADMASVVINYANLEKAAKRIDPIIAVAMEYKAFDAIRSQPGVVTFYVFAPDEGTGEFRRVASANFDGRGEKSVPGACTVCHGGRVALPAADDPTQTYAGSAGDVGALFMPWDLESFLYADDTAAAFRNDPRNPANQALREKYTRSAQEGALKDLNLAALSTYGQGDPGSPAFACYANYDGPCDLVEGWYGGPNLPGTSFQEGLVPSGWLASAAGNPADSADIYIDVIAQNCRACHLQQISADENSRKRQFTRWTDLRDLAPLVRQHVFDEGWMPSARLTDDRFWDTPASLPPGDTLAAHFESALDPGSNAPNRPGDPVARLRVLVRNPGEAGYQELNESTEVRRNAQLRLDGATSLFPEFFSHELQAGEKPVGSESTIAHGSLATAGLQTDLPGTYRLRLMVAGSGDRSTTLQDIVVINEPPTLIPLAYTVEQGGLLSVTDPLLGLRAGASDPEGDSLAFTYDPGPVDDCPTENSSGAQPPVVNANGTFTLTHDGGPVGQFAQFRARVTDEFGAFSTACVSIGVSGAPDSVPPTVPGSLVATAQDGNLAPAATFPVSLSWSASTDVDDNGNPQSVIYRVLRRTGAGAFGQIATVDAPGYIDSTGAPSTPYDYRITAEDPAGNTSQSSISAATTRSSYAQNVDPLWSTAGPGGQTCQTSGCHNSSASGGLRLDQGVASNFVSVQSRVNGGNPPAGLIPCVPSVSEGCSHSAGSRFAPGSPAYDAIIKWISEGARNN